MKPLFKKSLDTSEVVDPITPRGIDRRTIMICLLALACLITAVLIATSGKPDHASAPVQMDSEVDVSYGGVFEVAGASIAEEEIPPISPPPDWSAPLATPPPPDEGDDRRARFKSAVRGGGGLLFSQGTKGAARGSEGEPGTAEAGIQSPSSRTLMEGAIIDAVLETAINSDRPGPVSARVLEDVKDTQTISETLIPAGTRVLGSMTGVGEVVALSWHRLIFPDGSSMRLDQLPSLEGSGGGVSGEVDRHRAARIGNAALMALVGAGAALGGAQLSEHGGLVGGALALQLGLQSSRTLQQVRRPPTITVEAGHRFQIWVTRDLQF